MIPTKYLTRGLRYSVLTLFGVCLQAQTPCVFSPPAPSFTIRHVDGHPALNLDPEAPEWKDAASQSMSKDCRFQADYPEVMTNIRAFWTDTDLYILFHCLYTVLNVFPADNSKDHVGLWDRDVVEMFIGDDWKDIRHYREFEIAPTGDWVDLAIDLNRHSYDPSWNSGWQTMARIDKEQKIWYAAAKIPLSAVSANPVQDGTKWRINLYRISGLGPDSQRHFICWQPICVPNRNTNHVPERFGTLIFAK